MSEHSKAELYTLGVYSCCSKGWGKIRRKKWTTYFRDVQTFFLHDGTLLVFQRRFKHFSRAFKHFLVIWAKVSIFYNESPKHEK